MIRLTLREWASVAEIAGTIAVVISLLMVVYSLERNTVAISAQGVNEIYDGYREIQVALLADPELIRVSVQGREDPGSLSEMDREIFQIWVALNLDLWDRMLVRISEGLIDPDTAEPWDEYFREWTRRNVTREHWEEHKWGWPSGTFQAQVEAVLDH
jgi:hypothetical protein